MKKTIWTVVVIIVLIIVALLLSAGKGSPSSTGPIKVGFIGPLTGDASSLGEVAKAAVELATDEINAAGGVNGRQINVTYEDGKCGADASQAANKLVNVDGVSLIVGGLCSGETASFVKDIGNKIPVVSYCSSAPTLSGAAKFFSRDYPSDAFQGKYAAEYLYNTLGARKVVVFYHISDWGTGVKTVFESRFKELGGQIVDEEGTPQTAKDYRTEIAKIKTFSADYIYMPMFPEGGTVAVNQLNQLGVKTKIFGADAWSDPKFQADVNGKGDIFYTKIKVPNNDAFNAKLLAKSGGKEIPICAPQAYDAMKLAAQVIAQVGVDPQKFTDALRTTTYNGVSGQISFEPNGDLATASYAVERIANGTEAEVK
ncbi:MAG: penicillin-binding protein activator [Candidatus Pacebacteria bacterium]|nr:penicillin-binding protein activator [Candidatus Paceibacterota bacterium]